jgi:prolyl oligopeptidase
MTRSHGRSLAVVLLAVVLVGAQSAPGADPYRAMETGGPDYRAWLDRQLAATHAMLTTARAKEGFSSESAPAPERLTSLTLANRQAFYVRNDGQGDELFERSLRGGSERIIARAGQFDRSPGSASLGAFAVSKDGALVAIHVYTGPGFESDIHVMHATDGRDVEPPVRHTIFDYVQFTPDARSIVYAATPEHSQARSVPGASYDFLHRIGTAQSSDNVLLGPGISARVEVPPHAFTFVDPDVGGGLAVAEVRDPGGVGSRFYCAPLASAGKEDTPWRALGTARDHYTDYAVQGTTIDLATDAGAPNYEVVRASLVGPFAPRVVLPASPVTVVSGTLDGIPKAGIFALNAAKDADYVQLLDHGQSRMVRIPYAGDSRPAPVPLPLSGSVLEVAVDPDAPGAAIDLTSWTQTGDVFAFDPRDETMTAAGLVPAQTGPPRTADELTATAPDGTPVGVSVIYRTGTPLDGSRPLLLRVAGAYGFSITPAYGIVPEAWLARGGIVAYAHVRGGGELGEAWHQGGMGMRKSNTWMDLIAAANRLVEAKYTSPRRLNLYGTLQSYLGGIASSIAIGRAIEERPDLFAAAVVDAPAFDMLSSERTKLGHQSISEFGTVATKEGFDALYAMSPYEHLQKGVAYPPMLVRSLSAFGLGDDWQAAKMVARLQAVTGSERSAYLDIPSASRGTRSLQDDAFAFLLYQDDIR